MEFHPLTDEQIRQVTVGEPTVLDNQITLVEYDREWPRQFECEAARIRAALSDRAIRIEHIGSTSVPGLIAKPVIDMLLVVADSADEPSYVPALESAGFVLRIREREWYEHRLFKGPQVDINLHVFSEGSEEIERILLFRDRLRASASDRDLYARTKQQLAERRWKYVQNYADAKAQIVNSILAGAREEQ